MINPLQYDFMRIALALAVLIGLTAPAIGTFIVQRRLALLGDGIGHIALTGIGLGLLLFPLMMLVRGRWREVHPITYGLFLGVLAYFIWLV